jgi:hypothetical protein
MAYKIHLIYGGIILGLGGYILLQKPKIITQTQIETKEKIKTEEKVVYRDKIIETTKPNGEKIKETIRETIASNTKEKEQNQTQVQTKFDVKSKYSLEIAFAPIHNSTLHTQPTLQNLSVTAGVRLFNSPMFATIGSRDNFKTYFVGVRYEF